MTGLVSSMSISPVSSIAELGSAGPVSSTIASDAAATSSFTTDDGDDDGVTIDDAVSCVSVVCGVCM